MICDNCKHFFTAGNRPDGVPNGVAFVQKNRKKITMCADCIIKLGKMDEDQKKAFFENLKEKGK